MNQPDKLTTKQYKAVHNFLLVAVAIMAVPLALEFCIFLPLLILHAINKEGFWALAVTISITGIVAIVTGLCALGFIVFRGKKYITDARAKRLKLWIIVLSLAYVVVIGMIGIGYLRLVHVLN